MQFFARGLLLRIARRSAILACLAAPAAAQADPAAVIARVTEKVRALSAKLPNYTCVQTVTRDYYMPKPGAPPEACSLLIEQLQPIPRIASRLTLTDRLRLDVAMTARGEIYSWAGASRFEDGGIEQLVRDGPLGTGAFGALLSIVCKHAAGAFHFERAFSENGRALMEFSFQVPQADSHYQVKSATGWIFTAYSGSLQVDPKTSDVVRMDVATAELPKETGSCRTMNHMEYVLVRIGASQFPLPKQGRQRFLDIAGNEAENTTTFAACREYLGESTIRFGDDAGPSSGDAASSAPAPIVIPAGLPFTFELAKPISADTAAGGDAISGRLVADLRDASRRLIAPAHALVEGRLLHVEIRRKAPVVTMLGIKLTSIEIGGVKVPFAAAREPSRAKGGLSIVLPAGSWEANAGMFPIAGVHGAMKPGSRTEWRTAQ